LRNHLDCPVPYARSVSQDLPAQVGLHERGEVIRRPSQLHPQFALLRGADPPGAGRGGIPLRGHAVPRQVLRQDVARCLGGRAGEAVVAERRRATGHESERSQCGAHAHGGPGLPPRHPRHQL